MNDTRDWAEVVDTLHELGKDGGMPERMWADKWESPDVDYTMGEGCYWSTHQKGGTEYVRVDVFDKEVSRLHESIRIEREEVRMCLKKMNRLLDQAFNVGKEV